MNKNYNLAKNITLIVIGALCFIFSLVGFIQSYAYYDDGFGVDISFDNDYFVMMIVSLILIIYSTYILYMDKKCRPLNKNAYYASCGLIGVISACYPLGVFFKALTKALSKNQEFDYIANQTYLYISIIGIAITLYVLFSYLSNKKK